MFSVLIHPISQEPCCKAFLYLHDFNLNNPQYINPFYPEHSVDELQPVPDHFHKINLSALKMYITLLFLNQVLNMLYY